MTEPRNAHVDYAEKPFRTLPLVPFLCGLCVRSSRKRFSLPANGTSVNRQIRRRHLLDVRESS